MKRFNAITAISAASFLLTAPLAAQVPLTVRVAPGALQLQAHDRDTDVEFTNFPVAALK